MIVKHTVVFVKIVLMICLVSMQACDNTQDIDGQELDSNLISNKLFEMPPPEVMYADSTLRRVLNEELIRIKSGKTGRFTAKQDMAIIKKNPKKVFVHYMPWFQSKDVDGHWGQHWTMSNKNPDKITGQGLEEIASYYNPLIGPYSSVDADLQEYHFLLMKLSGVDGIIFDWYGSRDTHDYGVIKRATEKFIPELENIDLEFSIMYEDRVSVMPDVWGVIDPVQQAKLDFQYILDTYFTSPNYMKHKESKVVSVFGPKYIIDKEQWDAIFSIFPAHEKPAILSLWAAKKVLGTQGKGEFLWLSEDHLLAQDYYYQNLANSNEITMGSAYPGFQSFYEEGGWEDGVNKWSVPMKNGTTFIETLNNSHLENADFIQVITWNDFGEGTMIEPTAQFGFKYLEILQQYTGVSYNEKDLASVVRLYQARKKYKENDEVMELLDQTYIYTKKLNIKRVNILLQAINRFYD